MPPKGAASHAAKLSKEDARRILDAIGERDRLLKKARALSAKQLAQKFGVSVDTINSIAAGRTWRHV